MVQKTPIKMTVAGHYVIGAILKSTDLEGRFAIVLNAFIEQYPDDSELSEIYNKFAGEGSMREAENELRELLKKRKAKGI